MVYDIIFIVMIFITAVSALSGAIACGYDDKKRKDIKNVSKEDLEILRQREWKILKDTIERKRKEMEKSMKSSEEREKEINDALERLFYKK